MSAACAVAVLAKAPLAGYAKTRLAPVLGAAGAAALAERLLEHAVAQAVAAGLGPVALWAAPDTAHAAFTRLASRHGLALLPQGEGDLGARMARVFETSWLATAAPLLLMGTDAPALDSARLRDAAAALKSSDAVFVPAFDGGYALIGLRAWDSRLRSLFEGMAWSTAQVMADTRERLVAAGLRHAELAAVPDIDEPADLMHLPAGWCADFNADRRAGHSADRSAGHSVGAAVTMPDPTCSLVAMPDLPDPAEPHAPDAAPESTPTVTPEALRGALQDALPDAALGGVSGAKANTASHTAPDTTPDATSETAPDPATEDSPLEDAAHEDAALEDAATEAAPSTEAPAAPVAAPVAAKAPATPDLSPAACAARLAELFPALFGAGRALPIKLRIQNDIQQRAPGIFTRKSLSPFLHRYTTSTAYLKALVHAPHRFDLDGAPAGDIDDVHRQAAATELERRRSLFEARRAAERAAERAAANEARRASEAAARQQHAAEDQARRDRAALLRAYESSTLTRANFCALKGIAETELDGRLHQAWLEREQRAQEVRAAGGDPQSRGEGRPPIRTNPGPGREPRPGAPAGDRPGGASGPRAEGRPQRPGHAPASKPGLKPPPKPAR